MVKKLTYIAVLITTCLTLSSPSWAIEYAFTDLGTLGGTNSSASSVNNTGVIVGTSSLTGNTLSHATLWEGTSIIDLGGFYQENSTATAISNSGKVAGSGYAISYGKTHAAGWYDTSYNSVPTDLGLVDQTGAGQSNASSINDAGKIVGSGQSADYFQHATLWKAADQLKDISKGGALLSSAANGINNSDQVVGWNDSTASGAVTKYAALWSPAANGNYVETKLGNAGVSIVGGYQSYATAINDNGSIVGSAQFSSSSTAPYHAAKWEVSDYKTLIDLGTLGGAYSFANSINSDGLVVGSSQTDGNTTHATLWNDTTAIDLNTLLDPATFAAGWVLTSANDINDLGWIVGNATNATLGITRGFLLTPTAVPVPAAVWLFSSGLGIMAFRRRKSQRLLEIQN